MGGGKVIFRSLVPTFPLGPTGKGNEFWAILLTYYITKPTSINTHTYVQPSDAVINTTVTKQSEDTH